MGFSHEKPTHRFRLYEDGGAIEVEAKSADDTASRDQIRGHLRHIATGAQQSAISQTAGSQPAADRQ